MALLTFSKCQSEKGFELSCRTLNLYGLPTRVSSTFNINVTLYSYKSKKSGVLKRYLWQSVRVRKEERFANRQILRQNGMFLQGNFRLFLRIPIIHFFVFFPKLKIAAKKTCNDRHDPLYRLLPCNFASSTSTLSDNRSLCRVMKHSEGMRF